MMNWKIKHSSLIDFIFRTITKLNLNPQKTNNTQNICS
jgi:hypothetical protein